MVMKLEKFDLDKLYIDLQNKKKKSVNKSYTSFLLNNKQILAKKIGEESTEVLIEFFNNNKENLIKESADLLYHLNVMWLSLDISPKDIWKELYKRKNTSGFTEKENRKKNDLNYLHPLNKLHFFLSLL